MKGHENLIPNSERSPDEVRKNSAKGGVKSGVTRRRRKAIKEILAGAWNIRICDIEDPGIRKAFQAAAKSETGEITIGEAMANGMVLAMMRGSAHMSQVVLDLMRETPEVKLREKELKLKERELRIKEKLAEKDLQEDEPSEKVEFTFERGNEMKVNVAEKMGAAFDPVFWDAQQHGHTYYWLAGGRGSTKSSFVGMEIPLLMLQHPECHAVVLRKVGGTIKNSVYPQIQWGLEQLQVLDRFKYKMTPPEMTLKRTGQKILFLGCDDPMKVKSIKLPFGYVGIVWLEELDQFSGMEEIRNLCQSLLRGGPRYWVFCTYNPPKSRSSWVNEEILVDDPDRMVHRSTYLQVPQEWLGEQFLQEAEKLKERNEMAYRHEYLGEVTGTGGAVFENVEDLPLTDEALGHFDHRLFGLDFGFAVDPLAFVAMHFDAKHEDLYIWGEIYEQKLTNPQAVARISKIILPQELVRCDSAEPKSIKEMRSLGMNIIGAAKGPDSVEYGIKWLQGLRHIYIDKRRCPNAYREFMTYEYERNRLEQYISAYPDKDNHAIDAVRYGCSGVMPVRTTIRPARFDY